MLLQRSPSKSPKKKEPQSSEKNQKKNSGKKSGFVTNSKAPPRPISDDASDTDFAPAKRKSSGKKSAAPPKPKVVPKKSATAKTILKGGLSKSKKYIDTESDSDIDDSMIKIVQNANKKIEKKMPQEKAQKSSFVQKESAKKVSKVKHDTDSNNSDDSDISVINNLPKSGKNSPSPPTLTPQKQKPKPNVKPQKKLSSTKHQKTNKSKQDSRKFRSSSIESIDNSSIHSIYSLDSDSDATIEQKMKKIRPKKGQPTSPKVICVQ